MYSNNVDPQVIESHGIDNINAPIDRNEVLCAIKNAYNGKARGCDDIPVEALQKDSCSKFLVILFNRCFNSGKIPDIWQTSIINPITKCATTDPRIPLNYRGIALACHSYQLFCAIPNKRITWWSDINNIIADEQNGFREGRSCLDHLSSITQIIETRKHLKQATYVSFMDFSKAFDRVNRNILWSKLNSYGLNGKILKVLQSLYSNVKCCIRINNRNTDLFEVSTGVKQGCLLSPILFSMYINDLTFELKNSGFGIDINGEKIPLLLYADDLVLLVDSGEHLQQLLNIINTWCSKSKIKINSEKSKVVHIRPNSKPRTHYIFKCGDDTVEVVDKYKYLGLILTEYLDYKFMADTVAKSASRALGFLISKSKSMGGVPFRCFTKLYDALVMSVINYGSSIWGGKEFSSISSVHNRAGRYYLGLGRYTPNAALQGELGWKTPLQRHWSNIANQWSRLVNMPVSRLNKRIFNWCNEKSIKCV